MAESSDAASSAHSSRSAGPASTPPGDRPPAAASVPAPSAATRPADSGDSTHHSATPILVGLVVGLLAGLIANGLSENSPSLAAVVKTLILFVEPIGKIFLRLMFMVVVPLVFSALVLAVVEIGDLRKLGRMGLRTLGFTAVFSTAAVVIGVLLVNVFQPGKSLSGEKREQLVALYDRSQGAGAFDQSVAKIEANKNNAKSLGQTLIDFIPENPLQEMVGAVDGSSKGGGMLAVMCCALIVGVAITLKPQECQPFVDWLGALQTIAGVIIGFALKLAPLGAGCLVFTITAQLGLEVVKALFWFAITVIVGLSLQLFVTYSVVLRVFGGMSPGQFFRSVAEAMLTAFSTSSSNATLPTAIRVADDELRLQPRVSRFVLTVGATGNQNGTALYEGVVVLFLAQVMGVTLTFPQQLQVVVMSVLAGVGTAGVPGGSLPLIMVLMESVGVPASSIGIILGADRLLDMCRTVVNVTGDLAVATCVNRSELRAESTADVEPAAS